MRQVRGVRRVTPARHLRSLHLPAVAQLLLRVVVTGHDVIVVGSDVARQFCGVQGRVVVFVVLGVRRYDVAARNVGGSGVVVHHAEEVVCLSGVVVVVLLSTGGARVWIVIVGVGCGT